MEYVDVLGQTHPSSFSLEYFVDYQEQANIFLQNSTNCKERAFLLKRYLYSRKYILFSSRERWDEEKLAFFKDLAN